MLVRRLEATEVREAMRSVWKMFIELEAPKSTVGGVTEFKKLLDDEMVAGNLIIYGAFDDGTLVGAAVTGSAGSHVMLMIADKEYMGFKTLEALLETVLKNCVSGTVTANAAFFVADMYRRLGFIPAGSEILIGGLRIIPMVYSK